MLFFHRNVAKFFTIITLEKSVIKLYEYPSIKRVPFKGLQGVYPVYFMG